MNLLIVLVFTASCAAAAAELFRGKPSRDTNWKIFKTKHGKTYKNSAEEAVRRELWETIQDRIEQHNKEAAAGKHTFIMGDNHLSDMTEEEVASMLKARVPKEWLSSAREYTEDTYSRQTIPASVDWRTSSCMPAVKDQGLCGSCWSFSANTPFEYRLCKKTGKLISLSEQQLIDCSRSYGTDACDGGWYDSAWKYVKAAPGEASAASYPYRAKNGTCKYAKTMSVGTVAGFVRLPKNETAIRSVVASSGPVSVAIQVLPSFETYSSGVYAVTNCPADSLTVDHAIVVVGFGTRDLMKYWIIRNSWGTSWGMLGYALMKRGVNLCNIEAFAAYPTV